MNKRIFPPPRGLLRRNKGFTLAEVLITLVIIGVIAAMTIPTIIANSKRQEVSARLKKFYSTINQACMKAKAMGQDWDEWAEAASITSDSSPKTGEEFAKQYLLPYINYTETITLGVYYGVYLADGTYFGISKGDCLGFDFDTNGKKAPNQLGRDQFRFLYCPLTVAPYYGEVGKVIPFRGRKDPTREQALEDCKNDYAFCSYLLMMDGWEVKKDYPYNI